MLNQISPVHIIPSSLSKILFKFCLGCLHPVAGMRSGERDFRLRNIPVVFTIYFLVAACFSLTTIFKGKCICAGN
jgi:hypothetical protein